jgi:hypothetical protein
MLIGVVAKLTTHTYKLIVRADYEHVATRLFRALGQVRHVVFVHDAVLTGRDERPEEEPEYADETYYDYLRSVGYFAPPPPDVRLAVNALLETNHVNISPYSTNAEMEVLAAAFVEDNEKNLLFRIYVPAGRLYAAEADKLLSLFREWLTQVKKQRVRQDGYKTGSGQVYEFFGDADASTADLSVEFDDFSRFLDLCVDDPDEASKSLFRSGIDPGAAEDIVRRYGKETRRLHLDIRHAREARMLSIRQRLESELVDELDSGDATRRVVDRSVEALVPWFPNLMAPLDRTGAPTGALTRGDSRPVQVTINQQIVHAVEGTVIQSVEGTVQLDAHAKELIELAHRFGGQDSAVLQSAVHELEDEDARHADRLAARQRLKGFLFKLGGKVEEAVIAALLRHVESKVSGIY